MSAMVNPLLYGSVAVSGSSKTPAFSGSGSRQRALCHLSLSEGDYTSSNMRVVRGRMVMSFG
jgi:hypothetical protein